MAEKEDYLVNNNFYAGADYGMDSSYGKEWGIGYGSGEGPSVSEFGFTTDPRTANQIKAVSDKLSTGAKTIEISGVSPEVLENLPEQHLTEINRLKKLVGADLTFHGPLVEPTGVSKQGWNESHREQAERQMVSATRRAHKLDPKGNIVITFHSSNGLPDPVTMVKTEVIDPKTGKKEMKEQIKEFWVVDERDGRFQNMTPKPDYFKSEEEKHFGSIKEQQERLKEAVKKQNQEQWYKQIYGINFHAEQGSKIVEGAVAAAKEDSEENGIKDFRSSPITKIYKKYLEGENMQKAIESLGAEGKDVQEQINGIIHGDIYLRDAYQDLQNSFNQAYEVAKINNNKDDLKKLNNFRNEIKGHIQDFDDPEKVIDFGKTLIKGVNVLRTVNAPEVFKPLREFAVNKSSETFANVALDGYKKFGKSAPIISIENPPAGTGLTRADDLKDVVKETRARLSDKLMKEGMTRGQSEKEAEKLIGVTWDVGHINMIRKFGYDDSDVVKETKKIAPFVKHVHLSDNFGLEHTELPMGMGNVPTKKMLDLISKYNKQAKKIVETGPWFQHFKTTPMLETLRAFGSPIYAMEMGPSWKQAANASGGYFVGYGQSLPEQHFNIYGSGFSNLPPELGGQLGGGGRMSGRGME
jgi:sugar phosphate isomerase/epimerase